MFGKKKKRLEISGPSNFEHRVHTGFDHREQKFTGLPQQWHSLLADTANRPKPMVDPSCITPIQLAPMKVSCKVTFEFPNLPLIACNRNEVIPIVAVPRGRHSWRVCEYRESCKSKYLIVELQGKRVICIKLVRMSQKSVNHGSCKGCAFTFPGCRGKSHKSQWRPKTMLLCSLKLLDN